MNVRSAFESGGGLAPTTALQNAGARFGKNRGKSATFWSAAMERKRIRRFRAGGEGVRSMNVRSAFESGGGLAPT
ncbi:MAG TPA: hypothetical protein VMS21_10015, partial [Methylomirabilota bacterium]|nr:hypothetical protein [Methylomirabilota bacterium]